MVSLFKDLQQGLTEAIDFAKGTGRAKVTRKEVCKEKYDEENKNLPDGDINSVESNKTT